MDISFLFSMDASLKDEKWFTMSVHKDDRYWFLSLKCPCVKLGVI